MIATEQKPFAQILESLKGYTKLFLVGCGECATTFKTGGKEELAAVKLELEKNGKIVLGMVVPDAPCVAIQARRELLKNTELLSQAEVVLIFACGLGIQSVKECNSLNIPVLPGCNTMFGSVIDRKGNFLEKCSLCGDCILELTAGICPITLCSKGLLNGPCGGMNKGKCEVDKDRDCGWVLIYKELAKENKLDNMRKIQSPKDFKKQTKPHKLSTTR